MKRILPIWLTAPTTSVNNDPSNSTNRTLTTNTTPIRPLFDINEPFVPYRPNPNTENNISAVPNNSSQEYTEVEICDPQRFIYEEPEEATSSTHQIHATAGPLLLSTIIPEATVSNSSNSNQINTLAVSVQQPVIPKVEIKEEPVDGSGSVNSTTATASITSSLTSTTTATTNSASPTTSTTTTVIKTEVKSENADSSTPARRSCTFGIKCYRRNAEHRLEEAHPGDSDYRRPDFPAPPPGTPDCPFGSSCYRRNPDHFQRLNHPPSCIYNPNTIIPAAPPTSTRVQPQQSPQAPLGTNKRKRNTTNPSNSGPIVGTTKRLHRNVFVTYVGSAADSDDDEEEADFINDDSSDEFDPTKHNDDDDEDDSENLVF